MEELAWEESLIGNGTHPELHYIHSELSRRKNKRLELAKRKCEFEVSNVTKKRRIDESSVWQTWKVQRDQLQTDIIAETNRKRRKLERERRAADRPQPVRRVPLPPDPRFSYSLPPPPTLRQVVDSFPLPNESNILTRHQDSTRFNVPKTRPHVNGVNGVNGTGAKRSRLNGIAPAHPPLGLGSLTSLVAYPELSTLSSAEVQGDLERLLIGARRSGMSNQGPPLPVGMGVDRMGNIPGPINVLVSMINIPHTVFP
ncbi:hypothetical protein GYMLUDRAFT_603956 [Collybiopsis luxurians FD-317 M1]|uniref:Uncharacterized protein n=1 Tax=Collybiopsis luxurians FD-317 M1 TaxID=944289 RepID=A0A0D0CCV1_9AGAR|nr:hypothetical protein GYMLUDRAFT_603956 [Collybiopsis luxurians FD-317 M1]